MSEAYQTDENVKQKIQEIKQLYPSWDCDTILQALTNAHFNTGKAIINLMIQEKQKTLVKSSGKSGSENGPSAFASFVESEVKLEKELKERPKHVTIIDLFRNEEDDDFELNEQSQSTKINMNHDRLNNKINTRQKQEFWDADDDLDNESDKTRKRKGEWPNTEEELIKPSKKVKIRTLDKEKSSQEKEETTNNIKNCEKSHQNVDNLPSKKTRYGKRPLVVNMKCFSDTKE